jgi:DNA polymerase-3 subunit delta'
MPAVAKNITSLPEADRLGEFPHPRNTKTVYGHSAAMQEFCNCLKAGRLHHAWLLSGPDGIGKATLAYAITRKLLAGNQQQIASLTHPNLLLLRRLWQDNTKRFGKFIPVDEVRRLQKFLHTTAGDGLWRVMIVDKADDLNQSAANALLKLLEEPPAHCVFLLLSSQPGKLPVTVRSRCRSLKLLPLQPDDLKKAIAGTGIYLEAAEMAQLVELAQGSVKLALELASSKGLDIYTELVDIVSQLPMVDYRKVHTLADKLGRKGGEDDLGIFFTLLNSWIRNLVTTAIRQDEPSETSHFKDIAAVDGLAKWAELWEKIAKMKTETFALNLDKKALVLETFFQLEKTARQKI